MGDVAYGRWLGFIGLAVLAGAIAAWFVYYVLVGLEAPRAAY